MHSYIDGDIQLPHIQKWDMRFLTIAQQVAAWSKDPSTQTGAVIVRGRDIVATGYNGFPRGVRDDAGRYADRATKYEMIIHCEINAILQAKQSVAGCTLYTAPFPSCSRCAAVVIQSGIARCVAPYPSGEVLTRWKDSLKLTCDMFREAGVNLTLYTVSNA